MLVPKDEDELDTILSRRKSSENFKENLGVTIQPTVNCQLGYHYCDFYSLSIVV